ncbi:MAG: hypothetical protein DI629_20320 [Mesorhizobium amorphae]|nr:MAG: hypothetical protein DI629_20320 [Mesorhizobium amorphae]
MPEDMFRPTNWVSVSLQAERFFVHLRENGRRTTLGPFATNREATSRARREAERLGLNGCEPALSLARLAG